MSTRFLIVKEEPKDLPKDAYVIKSPDFLEQIQENKGREPKGGHTAPTHLRYIVGSIGAKYDQDLSAYTVKPHLYEGRKYDSDEELSKIVLEMLNAQYPKIFDSYLDYKIKNRPANAKLIYFIGDYKHTKAFIANGISVIDERELDQSYSPKKSTKKPTELPAN